MELTAPVLPRIINGVGVAGVAPNAKETTTYKVAK